MNIPDTVLLWGFPDDPPIAAVRNALLDYSCRTLLVDQHAVLDTAIEMTIGSTVSGVLRMQNESVELDRVKALYLRPNDLTRVPGLARAGMDSASWLLALTLQDILFSWAELTPALVLNRPDSMASNDSKPYQAACIQSAGFAVPDTLMTTDPRAALEFWKQYNQVIYKSMSSVRSIVTRLRSEHLPRLDDVVACPTQFQQYIPGDEYRVHVVGEQTFACRVYSDADDYRYSPAAADFEPCDLPSEIADRCKHLATSLDLTLAGLDLRCTPEGLWFCFEANPSPAFTVYERVTGQPISRAVANLLASAPGHSL